MDKLLSILCYVLPIELAAAIVFGVCNLRHKKHTDTIKAIAKSSGSVYASSIKMLPEFFQWKWSDYNSRAVFLLKNTGSIAVFDYNGNAVAEIILPIGFDRFKVDDEKIVCTKDAVGEIASYSFTDILCFGSGSHLRLPPEQDREITLSCSKYGAVIHSQGRNRHLCAFNTFVVWPFLYLWAASAVLDAVIRIIVEHAGLA